VLRPQERGSFDSFGWHLHVAQDDRKELKADELKINH